MTTITFKTIKGATIELTSTYAVSAKIVGRDDMKFANVALVEVAGHGLCVEMGTIKAQVRPEDQDSVRAFFAENKKAREARIADDLNSEEFKTELFHDQMRGRMYARNSNH